MGGQTVADEMLFDVGTAVPSQEDRWVGTPRVQRPVRNPLEFISSDLDSLLPDEHPARTVWSYVEKVDLSGQYDTIRAVEGGLGRSPIAPEILLALWLYATLDHVGSARTLAKLCAEHVAYRWLCGGVSVNDHTLADFRSQSGTLLDEWLTDSVVRLRAAGAVTLERVALDGVRVRASAGRGSFKRKAKLEQFRQEAAAQIQSLKQELEADPAVCDKRRKAARERAVRERQERIAAALEVYPQVKAEQKHNKESARASTTDADARIMHMPDGGFRPACNVQFVTDTGSLAIVGAEVLSHGSDGGHLPPAVQQIQTRYGVTPKEALVDGGYVKRADIEQLATAQPPCRVYAPPPELKTHDGREVKPPSHESAAVKEWRERMKTAAAQQIYKERAATAECVNAQARNRGFQQFVVRGLTKVRNVALLFAWAHTSARMTALLGRMG
jgi:transposase